MKWVVRFTRGNPLYIIEGVFVMERTFLMVKPDGVQRNLIGEIVSRFESKGFQLVGAKLMQITEELASATLR